MAQAKTKPKGIMKGDKVKITDGEHSGQLGKVVHLRAATGEAHVELAETGKTVNVPVADLAAA